MKLETRLTFLFVLMFAAFLGAIGVLRLAQRNSAQELRAEIAEDKARQLARAIAVTGATLERFVSDYTQWDEMCDFVASHDPDWAAINIDQSLQSWHFHGAWVFDADRHEIYRRLQAPFAAGELKNFPEVALVQHLCGPERLHFFTNSPHGLLEVRTAPIHPSDDARLGDPPLGWLVVARLWDQARFAELGQLTESSVGLAAPAVDQVSGSSIVSRQPLRDWIGNPAHEAVLQHHSPLLANMLSYDVDEVVLFLVVGLAFLVLTVGFLHRWVRRPLQVIETSLASDRPELVGELLLTPDAFGRIAALIRTTAEQRLALRREAEDRALAEQRLRRAIADRTALGRDLHDGVIQSIYATGMTLQGVGALLASDPGEARRRIESCVDGLNRTIAQIRNHIAGLEADGRATSLTDGLQRLLREMQLARPAEFDLRLDPLLVAALTEDSVEQLLFIAREAVSNAVRHGLARKITIHLGTTSDEPSFAIKDDGIGFDPAAPPRRGHGLDNMTRRAEEIGAALTVESVPGLGTRVRVELPWNGLKAEARDSSSSP